MKGDAAIASFVKVTLPVEGRSAAARTNSYRITRSLLWLYFGLLIFEGSLRKWILPQYSGPLLVIRDPVVLLIFMSAFWERCYPRDFFLGILYPIGAACVIASVLIAPGSYFITLYGAQADFLHMPLIFIMATALSREDLKRYGYAILILAGPTAALMMMQFLAAPDAVINRGTLGTESEQITAALGKIRPAAFFSYNTGAGQYLALLAAFIVYGLLAKRFPRWLIYIGIASLFMSVAVSGSRTTATELMIITAALCILWLIKPKAAGRMPAILICLLVIYLIVQWFSIFHQGIDVLQERTNQAFEAEPLGTRLSSNFELPLSEAPWFGCGLGVGTNVGAMSLSGQMVFLLAESEWPRLIMESGPILGGAYLLWRLGMVVYLIRLSVAAAKRDEFLAWLLVTAAAPLLISGNFGQATSLGFAVFSSGLCLAATRLHGEQETDMSAEDPLDSLPEPIARPGRSAFAERLHADIQETRKDA
jgi:hypothetical protein